MRTPAQAAAAVGAQPQTPEVHVHITSKLGMPDLTDYIDVRVSKGIAAQQQENMRVIRMGTLNRGLLAGV